MTRARRYRNYFTVIILALISAPLPVMLEVIKLPHNRGVVITLVLIAFPLIAIDFSQRAKQTIDRYYQGFLESIILIKKIENIFGFDASIHVNDKDPSPIVFPQDERFTIKRYYESSEHQQTSHNFKAVEMKKHDNKLAHDLFNFFMMIGIVSIVLLLLSIFAFQVI